MKKLFLLVISTVLLAGCTSPFDSFKTSSGADVKTTVNVVDAGTEVYDEVYEEELMKDYSCDMLKSKSREADCERMINEMIAEEIYSEISRTFDIKRCDELPGYMAEDCKNYIERTGVKGPVSEVELEALRNAMDMTYPEVTGEGGEDMEGEGYYDITKCAVLTTSGLKEYCEKKLNEQIEEEKLWEIIEGGNVSKCDELTNEDLKNMCKEEFGVYIEDDEEELIE